MKQRLLLLFLLSVLPAPALADGLRPQVSASYFGETILHPGGRAGADVTLLGGDRHRVLLGGDLGLYHHSGFQTGVLLDAVVGYRFTFESGLFLEGRLGVGYLRTFLAGDVYTRSADGSFAPESMAGANAFAPVQSLAVGYGLSSHFGLPLSVFAGLTAFEQVPFNGGYMVQLAAQLGVSWQFGTSEK